MKVFRNAALIAVPLLCTQAAHAVVIDFEDLAVNNAIANDVPSPYNSNGFTFLSQAPFHVWGTQSGFYPGSTALFAGGSDTITIKAISGNSFDFHSIDLAGVSLSGVQDITFTGIRADLTSIQESVHLASPQSLQTFNFSALTNVMSVVWGQSVPYHQFDNVNVTENVTPVPEPCSIAAFAMLGGALLRKRRQS